MWFGENYVSGSLRNPKEELLQILGLFELSSSLFVSGFRVSRFGMGAAVCCNFSETGRKNAFMILEALRCPKP